MEPGTVEMRNRSPSIWMIAAVIVEVHDEPAAWPLAPCGGDDRRAIAKQARGPLGVEAVGEAGAARLRGSVTAATVSARAGLALEEFVVGARANLKRIARRQAGKPRVEGAPWRACSGPGRRGGHRHRSPG